jgi:outer membrane pore protein F
MRARANYHFYTLLLVAFLLTGGYAQTDPGMNNEPGNDTLSKSKQVIKKANELTDIYGNLRFKVGIAFSGETGIQDNASRMGIKGAIPIINGVDAIMQLEVGVGLVGNKTPIKFNGDPGGAVGEVDNVFTSRLGYVGIRTKFGQITWGKQWSAYSDIGGQTDMYNGFGAEASGTYSAGTDGAISGSGRASNCVQYRLYTKYVETTIQVQNRNITDSSLAWGDTYGMSLTLKPLATLKIGGAYNKVRDGIQNPDVNKPKYGDEAWSTMINYNTKQFNAILTSCFFDNHEKYNLGNYFSGYGLELYCEYRLQKHWRFYGGFNYLDADKNSIAGEYSIQYVDFGSAYCFGRSSKLFIEIRLDDSRNQDGSLSRLSAIAIGMFFDFCY